MCNSNPKFLEMYVHFKVSGDRACPDSALKLRCEFLCEGVFPSPVTAKGDEASWLNRRL